MKNLKNLGTTLTKKEQKNVIGGNDNDIIRHVPLPGEECMEYSCINMPNPDFINGNGPAFVNGICRDGRCYYA